MIYFYWIEHVLRIPNWIKSIRNRISLAFSNASKKNEKLMTFSTFLIFFILLTAIERGFDATWTGSFRFNQARKCNLQYIYKNVWKFTFSTRHIFPIICSNVKKHKKEIIFSPFFLITSRDKCHLFVNNVMQKIE